VRHRLPWLLLATLLILFGFAASQARECMLNIRFHEPYKPDVWCDEIWFSVQHGSALVIAGTIGFLLGDVSAVATSRADYRLLSSAGNSGRECLRAGP
jgi:hypothetical protein